MVVIIFILIVQLTFDFLPIPRERLDDLDTPKGIHGGGGKPTHRTRELKTQQLRDLTGQQAS